jgi:hypothetical protein
MVLYLGPEVGTYALILFGALVGTMHSVAKTEFNGSRSAAALYMARWIATAFVLTAFVGAMVAKHTGVPVDKWPGVVAFGITFLSDKWPVWLYAIPDRFFPKKRGARK